MSYNLNWLGRLQGSDPDHYERFSSESNISQQEEGEERA